MRPALVLNTAGSKPERMLGGKENAVTEFQWNLHKGRQQSARLIKRDRLKCQETLVMIVRAMSEIAIVACVDKVGR